MVSLDPSAAGADHANGASTQPRDFTDSVVLAPFPASGYAKRVRLREPSPREAGLLLALSSTHDRHGAGGTSATSAALGCRLSSQKWCIWIPWQRGRSGGVAFARSRTQRLRFRVAVGSHGSAVAASRQRKATIEHVVEPPQQSAAAIPAASKGGWVATARPVSSIRTPYRRCWTTWRCECHLAAGGGEAMKRRAWSELGCCSRRHPSSCHREAGPSRSCARTGAVAPVPAPLLPQPRKACASRHPQKTSYNCSAAAHKRT